MALDVEIKRKINNCRDILVGKIPDPKAQIEQITIALIYKFLDDVDKAEGGNFYFKGELKDYSWDKLMDNSLDGEEFFKKYSEAINLFQNAKHFPDFFQSIFKNTYIPYKDARTLKMFLREIDYFSYDDSEKLGDAFEYLLSIMGSQGDAGQFRTPRHIIDFIVKVVEPKVGESVLDPACGTAGFLISAFKYMKENKKYWSRIHMTRVREGLHGFDISPDMVRMAKVNMFLHGFENPNIEEFDTLSNDKDMDKWNACYDVILANPPFMTPKGGINPHEMFSVESNRAEVLFVDYISSHLKDDGRAGIIVPEGIIFQSGKAYRSLREKLMERGLYAVVSLPAGVFNPYSGVKTSILLIDRKLKNNDNVLFLKVENDGLHLGAQRREIKENDLPLALEVLEEFKNSILKKIEPRLDRFEKTIAHIVHKDKIAEQDYNLSGDRYKEAVVYDGNWDLVELGEVINLDFGVRITKNKDQGTKYPVYGGGGQSFFTDSFNRENEYVISRFAMSENCVRFVSGQFFMMDSGFTFSIKDDVQGKLNKDYVGKILMSIQDRIYSCGRGHAQKNLDVKRFKSLEIPLPPLEVQERIVEEIKSYQNIIDGAKKVVESYKPSFKIDPDWDVVELGEKTEITSSKRIFQNEYVSDGIPFYRTKEIVELNDGKDISLELFISKEKYEEIKSKFDVPKKGEILLSAVGTIGISWVISDDREFYFKDGNLLWIKNLQDIDSYFLKLSLDYIFSYKMNELVFGAAYKALTIVKLKQIKIPLPPIETQKEIVSQIEEEQKLVDSNKQLIEIFEKKIKDKIAEVWGE